MDRFIGKKIDARYEIKELVGTGGMAVVYKALDMLSGMTVAVKILKQEYLNNEEFCERFRIEGKAMASLNHKNIIKVYDVSSNINKPYIVMEYIDGITLKQYIEQQNVLSWKEAVHFTTQILNALQHAHEKGIVHRDIKPQNVMLVESGDIKVMDFGIARIAGSEKPATTNNNQAIGSVHYISPEQARGAHTDPRADVYSVGVMLYEMLTGELPFDAMDTVSVAVMHLQADPRMPREVNPDIPVGLEEITMQAMQKDTAYRYQSAAAMLADINDFKRDPNIRFEYRYMVDDSPSRYINAINNTRRMQEEYERPEKSPVIPVLSGIGLAFVLITLVMVWLVLDESGIFASNTTTTNETPNFIGYNIDEVTSNPEYRYTFIVEYAFSNDYEQNQIINQNPQAGRNVYDNTEIRLTVSMGVERLLVPDYVGMTYDAFSEECILLGLKPSKIEVYDDNIDKGYVINTYPLPRSDISEGDTVEIYVSQGSKPTTLNMPNCQNMTYAEAKAKLEAMGIASTSITEVDSEKPAGTILSQEPAAGTVITETDTIKFTVSNGNAPTNSVTLDIVLPAELKSTGVRVEVILDGETLYNQDIDATTMDSVVVNVSGSGSSRQAKVYIDGKLYQTVTINFTTAEIRSITNNPDFVITTTTTPAPTTTTAAPSAEGDPTETTTTSAVG